MKRIKYRALLFGLVFSFYCCIAQTSEIHTYPIKSTANQTVLGTGLGLESGMIGIRYSHWYREPAVIFNIAFGLEGFTPTLRIPLLGISHYDFYLDMATLLTPGILGAITGQEEGILFSKDTFLIGPGIGIQRWFKQRTDYGFYFSAGLNYWFQITGDHEGGGDIGISPEFQIGVIF